MSDNGIDPQEIKEIMKAAHKEAMREFLDDTFATFGRWAAMTIAALVLVAFIYFILWTQGWSQRGAA